MSRDTLSRTQLSNPQVAFVTDDGGERRGVASALLQHALERMPADVKTLDAWTRDTVSTKRPRPDTDDDAGGGCPPPSSSPERSGG